ncbi:MAG: hypothetical protein SCALA702_28640 [Melioribacteraceae bacterium]|nr:MAG: hypothetical protein SCALA702_28640 [Melioribacteraceae bacterium]
MTKFVVLLLVSLSSLFYAQELSEYYQRIEDRIEFDVDYLDIHSMQLSLTNSDLEKLPAVVPTLGNNPVKFFASEDYTYFFVFIQKNINIDSLTLLRVEYLRAASQETRSDFFGGASTTVQEPQRETLLSFADLNELYFSDPELYTSITNFVISSLGQYEPYSRLNIPIEEYEIKRGMTSLDNTDFLNDMWIHSKHIYPKSVALISGNGAENLSPRARRRAVSSGAEFMIDASLAHASFYHKEMDLDFTILSAEMSMESDLLNLHPWQSMALNIGGRGLFFITGDKKRMKNDLVIDAKIMGRFAVGSESVASAMPFVGSDKPKLNVGTGLSFDISTTRYFDIPFLNLHFVTGGKNFDNPGVSFGSADSSYAFFTFNEFATTFSFYWNDSDEKLLRFRMDFGLGTYNVVKATYYKGSVSSNEVYNKWQPIINFNLAFVPKQKRIDNEIFGANLRIFDSVLKADFWLKLLELEGGHKFRFVTGIIFSPLYRSTHEWENSGSTMFGVRYRYGF